MIKRRLNFSRRTSESSEKTSSREEEVEWEMRPGGMLVQKRSESTDALGPNLGVRVVYGSVRYEISVSFQASFGELKKLLTVETGLQPAEQRLIFRGKERENGEYLDIGGVKDRSKVILIEDPSTKEKRIMEMRRNAKIQTTHRKINDVSMEVDKLADQVSETNVLKIENWVEPEKALGHGSPVQPSGGALGLVGLKSSAMGTLMLHPNAHHHEVEHWDWLGLVGLKSSAMGTLMLHPNAHHHEVEHWDWLVPTNPNAPPHGGVHLGATLGYP
ncbi:hypothetical protein Acr_00g0045840 [Actinidia rufa]|uniref:Ubiquitin-like domain-containing protein n=1 Tax=Actinidia rufa TaxID=165716 RepID=A0A7J0DJA1_9ERIC|nr:hypothetical protein Acr_00g0045840 [Actinidia rufa]